MRYLALLRGVNVGGKNKVVMARLTKQCHDWGFSEVKTYINSGNIIFEYENTNVIKVGELFRELLKINYSFAIPVTVIKADDYCRALNSVPDWWNQEKTSANNAIFVIPPIRVIDVLKVVGSKESPYELFATFGSMIFWTAPRVTFSRTNFSKVVKTNVYNNITIRNANTALKLKELLECS